MHPQYIFDNGGEPTTTPQNLDEDSNAPARYGEYLQLEHANSAPPRYDENGNMQIPTHSVMPLRTVFHQNSSLMRFDDQDNGVKLQC